MAIDPRISLAVQTPQASQAINIFENALMNKQARNLRASQEARQAEIQPFRNQILQQQVQSGEASASKAEQQQRLISLNQIGQRIKPRLAAGDIDGVRNFLINDGSEDALEALERLNAGDTSGLLDDIDVVNNLINQQQNRGQGASQREFNNLLRIVQDPNSTQIEKDSANRALGNKARVVGAAAKTTDVGGVPHVFDPVKQTLVPAVVEKKKVTAETVSESLGVIKGVEEKSKLPSDLEKQTQKQNIQRISELQTTERSRASTVNKAKRFLNAFTEGGAESGASRAFLNFLPGVFTDQAEFDETFNAFSEVAAREQLKASGETKPTDADVEGMKRSMFGIGRDEASNIRLLTEFINDQQNLDLELDELREVKQLGKLKTFTGSRKDISGFSGAPKNLGSLSTEELQSDDISIEDLKAERERLQRGG